MTVEHSERSHARLSASGSKRWMACTPSAALEDTFPASGSSSFAEEGTAAHELSELLIHKRLKMDNSPDKDVLEKSIRKAEKGKYYSTEMLEHVNNYLDYIEERFMVAKGDDSTAFIQVETRLDFSKYVPNGFGTGDIIIVGSGSLEIIDLKYGKGIEVSAEENSQMMLYALAAYEEYSMLYDIENIRMTIHQPRLNNVSVFEMFAHELLDWGEYVLKPAAEKAHNGEGEFVAGDHCQWCRAKATCRARADYSLDIARNEFKEFAFTDPRLLSVEEIADILVKQANVVKWATDVKEHALAQAESHGVKFPGFKLVEGRSNRKITDPEEMASRIEMFYGTVDPWKTPELKPLGDLEKMIGKKEFAESLSDLVVKPAGKPSLVPETDKRPELSSVESARSDFAAYVDVPEEV